MTRIRPHHRAIATTIRLRKSLIENGDPDFHELEPRGQLAAAVGGDSSGRLTVDDDPADIP
jgi:hypothetical protein